MATSDSQGSASPISAAAVGNAGVLSCAHCRTQLPPFHVQAIRDPRLISDPSYQDWFKQGYCSKKCFAERMSPMVAPQNGASAGAKPFGNLQIPKGEIETPTTAARRRTLTATRTVASRLALFLGALICFVTAYRQIGHIRADIARVQVHEENERFIESLEHQEPAGFPLVRRSFDVDRYLEHMKMLQFEKDALRAGLVAESATRSWWIAVVLLLGAFLLFSGATYDTGVRVFHRGSRIVVLGTFSCLLPLGPVVVTMALIDLVTMWLGKMNRSGRRLTAIGLLLALVGTAFSYAALIPLALHPLLEGICVRALGPREF